MRKINCFKQTTVPLKDLVQINQNCFYSTFASQNVTNRFNFPGCAQSKNIFDQFVYQDTITNKRIKVRQAKTSYGISRHIKNNSTYQQNVLQNGQKKKRESRFKRHESAVINVQKQMMDLNQCYLMLKSTQMFKLNSLRQKLFGNQQKIHKNSSTKQNFKQSILSDKENKQQQLRKLILKKKRIRQIVESTVNQASLTQFRNYYQDSDHIPNKKIMNMVKKLSKSINRHNIEKIVSTLQPTKNLDSQIIKKQQITEQISFEGQSKLKQQAIDFMRKQIKMNGQYLVKPPKDRLLYQKIFNNKSKNIKISDLLNDQTFKNYQNENNNQNSSKFCQNEKLQQQNRSEQQISIPSIININTFKKISNQQNQQNLKSVMKQNKKTNQNISQKNKKCKQMQKKSIFSQFTSQFNFKNILDKEGLGKVKTTFVKNKKLGEKKLSLKQQKFLFLLQNGILFDVQKQILMDQNKLYFQDKNQNNILHISSKNRHIQIFVFTIQQLKKIDTNNKTYSQKSEVQTAIVSKNRNNKTPLDLAILYGAKQIIQIILQIKLQYNICV